MKFLFLQMFIETAAKFGDPVINEVIGIFISAIDNKGFVKIRK